MSMHIQMHKFKRPRLILAMLAIMFMIETGLLTFYPCHSSVHIQQEITVWSNSQGDGPDDTFKTFQQFLEQYCPKFLPENFDYSNWAALICDEMCFACQFFTFPAQFNEPECRA